MRWWCCTYQQRYKRNNINIAMAMDQNRGQKTKTKSKPKLWGGSGWGWDVKRPGRKGGSNVHLSGKSEHEMFAQQQPASSGAVPIMKTDMLAKTRWWASFSLSFKAKRIEQENREAGRPADKTAPTSPDWRSKVAWLLDTPQMPRVAPSTYIN